MEYLDTIDTKVLEPEFYKTSIENAKIIAKTVGNMKSETAKRFISGFYNSHGLDALVLLGYINCDNISEILYDIILPFSDLPVFAEIIKNQNNKSDDELIEVDYAGMYRKENEKVNILFNFFDEYINGNEKAMFRSVEIENPFVISHLIKTGADINKSYENETLFQHACGVNHSRKMIEFLLKKGGDMHSKDKYNRTPLVIALDNRNAECIDVFIERRITEEIDTFKAVKVNSEKLSDFIIEKGINVNKVDPNCGFTLLHCAAQANNLKMVKYLIENGAAVDAKDKFGHTPLSGAVIANSYESVEYLLNAGADHKIVVGVKNLLFYAIQNNSVELIKILIQKGANVNSKIENRSLLCFVNENEKAAEIIDILIDSGADIESKNGYDNYTPFLYAVEQNKLEVAKQLAKRGANVHERCVRGNAVHLALYKIEMLRFLISLGIDLNIKKDSRTPLLDACCYGRTEECLELLKAGADLTLKDSNGYNCLHYAAQKSKYEVVKEIVQKKILNINERTKDGTAFQLATDNEVKRCNLNKQLSYWGLHTVNVK